MTTGFGQVNCHSANTWFARASFCLPKTTILGVVQVLVQAKMIAYALWHGLEQTSVFGQQNLFPGCGLILGATSIALFFELRLKQTWLGSGSF